MSELSKHQVFASLTFCCNFWPEVIDFLHLPRKKLSRNIGIQHWIHDLCTVKESLPKCNEWLQLQYFFLRNQLFTPHHSKLPILMILQIISRKSKRKLGRCPRDSFDIDLLQSSGNFSITLIRMDPPGALCWKLRAEGRKAVRWDEKRLLWMIVFCSTSSSFLLHLFSSGNSRMSLKSQRKDKISLPSNVSKKSVSLHFFCRSGGVWGPLWHPPYFGDH